MELKVWAADQSRPEAVRLACLRSLAVLGDTHSLSQLVHARLAEPFEEARRRLLLTSDPSGIFETTNRGVFSAVLFANSLTDRLRLCDEKEQLWVTTFLSALLKEDASAERARGLAWAMELRGVANCAQVLQELAVGETILLQALLATELGNLRPESREILREKFLIAGVTRYERKAPQALVKQTPFVSHGKAARAQIESWLRSPFLDHPYACLQLAKQHGLSRWDLEGALDVGAGEQACPRVSDQKRSSFLRGRLKRQHLHSMHEFARERARIRETLRPMILQALKAQEAVAPEWSLFPPDWLLLNGVLRWLSYAVPKRIREVESVLYSWLRSGPPDSSKERLGIADAWRLHLETVLPAFQDAGEGLVLAPDEHL
jgi:hypothetical protein